MKSQYQNQTSIFLIDTLEYAQIVLISSKTSLFTSFNQDKLKDNKIHVCNKDKI